MLDSLMEQFTSAVRSANRKDKEADLTDFERVALAMASGCAIDYSWNDGKMKIVTRHPIGIIRDNGRWIVREAVNA